MLVMVANKVSKVNHVLTNDLMLITTASKV